MIGGRLSVTLELSWKNLRISKFQGKNGQIVRVVTLQSDICSVNPWECLQATEGAYGRWLSADVVCHELAHQWFGNYVTCKDFDNISGSQPQGINPAAFVFVACTSHAACWPKACTPSWSLLDSVYSRVM